MKFLQTTLIFMSLMMTINASSAQTKLTEWEMQKIAAEFNQLFKVSNNSAYQKLNQSPWAKKKAKQKKQINKAGVTLSNCKDYSLKQRRQCVVRNNGAANCDRYYNARVDYCKNNFKG